MTAAAAIPREIFQAAASQAWADAQLLANERRRINSREFRGEGARLFTDHSPEVFLSGPAGTGKSMICFTYMHKLAVENRGFRGLIIRETRSSLTNTGLVTFEEQVLGPGHALVKGGPKRRYRETYQYPNGSVIDVGGMDRPSKVLSSEYDVIFVQQAEEVSEDAWETLMTRLRNYKIPWQQIVGDCNPSYPTHWLRQRASKNKAVMLDCRHEDNPLLYDGRAWTDIGRDYLSKLDALTGVRKRRLRYGEWAASEGAIYADYWQRTVHMVDSFTIPREWPRYRVIDFGYTNPLVCQWWAQDPDGRLYRYREIYKTGLTVRDLAAKIRIYEHWYETQKFKPIIDDNGDLVPDPKREKIVATICDWDAEDRATLEAEGIPTIQADKRVTVGIEAVQHRFQEAGDGKPRLFFLKNALVDPDPLLLESKKPSCTEDEIDGYVWADKDNKDEPVKRDDHGCFVAGTMVLTGIGWRPIETVKPGVSVLTSDGWRKVTDAAMTSESASVYDLYTSDGTRLRGTGNHPVWVEGRGYIELRAMRYGDIIGTPRNFYTRLEAKAISWLYPIPSSTKGSSFAATPTPKGGLSGTTIARTLAKYAPAFQRFTARFTKTLTGLYRKATTFITATATRSTTIPTTSKLFTPTPIRNGTPQGSHQNGAPSYANEWNMPELSRLNGTDHQKGASGTGQSGLLGQQASSPSTVSVSSAERSSAHLAMGATGFVATTVEQRQDAAPVSMMKLAPANDAAKSSPSTSTKRHGTAPVHVVAVFATTEKMPVYNLTVEGAHNYFANGILVHNCDALRYLVMHFDAPGAFGFASIGGSGQTKSNMPRNNTAPRQWDVTGDSLPSGNRWKL